MVFFWKYLLRTKANFPMNKQIFREQKICENSKLSKNRINHIDLSKYKRNNLGALNAVNVSINLCY